MQALSLGVVWGLVSGLCRRNIRGTLAALTGVFLAAGLLVACSPALDRTGNEPPDAVDRVRSIDLLPRFPKFSATADTGTGASNKVTSYGEIVPVVSPIGGATADAGGPGGEGYTLNFENAPITSVAKVVLGDILGVGYTIDQRAQGTISLSSGRPVPRSQILLALESALRTSNLVLVKDAAGYKIVPASEAAGSGSVDRADVGPPEPGYGITVVPLRYVSVGTISKLLEGFAAKPGMIRADPSGNMLIIAGTGPERRSALDTVLSFDADWMRGQSVGIFPVKNSSPETVISELEKILDTGEGGLSQNLVRFQAIARMNAVMVVSRKPQYLRTAENWIRRLDASDAAANGVKVYRVRYGDARQIAKLLNDMFVGGTAGSALDSASNSLAPGGGATTMSAVDRLTGGGSQQSSGLGGGGGGGLGAGGMGAGGLGGARTASSAGGGGGLAGTGGGNANTSTGGAFGDLSGSAFGGGGGGRAGGALLPNVRITADIANNSVLVYANQASYSVIERALTQLDRPQMQVAVEMTIAEITLNDTLNYGVQFFLNNKLGSVINAAGTSSTLGRALPGFNLVVGNALTPNVVLNALHSYTDVKVLSTPSLVVVDNQVATLQVGDQIPVTTGTATVLTGQNSVVNTIDYKNTGIILRVQPRINSNGNVLMDIEQEISNVANNGAQATLTPTVSQRKVKSSIMVTSGQTVLLAGLMSETQNRGRNGIPLVDQIPILGDLAASSNNRGLARTELIIFIKPQIIRDGVDASYVAEELRSKMRGGKIGSIEPPGSLVPFAPNIVK